MATDKMIQTDQVDPEPGMRAMSVEHPTEQPATLAQRIKGVFPGSVAEAISKHKLFVVICAAIAVCVCKLYWTKPTGKPSCPAGEGRRLMFTGGDDCPPTEEKAWYMRRVFHRDSHFILADKIEGPLRPAMIRERMDQIQNEMKDKLLFGWGRGGFPHDWVFLQQLMDMNQPALQDVPSNWPFSPVPAKLRSTYEEVLSPVKDELAALFPQSDAEDHVSQAERLLQAAGGSEKLALKSLNSRKAVANQNTTQTNLAEFVHTAMGQCEVWMAEDFARQECKAVIDGIEDEEDLQEANKCMTEAINRWQADKMIYAWDGSLQFKDFVHRNGAVEDPNNPELDFPENLEEQEDPNNPELDFPENLEEQEDPNNAESDFPDLDAASAFSENLEEQEDLWYLKSELYENGELWHDTGKQGPFSTVEMSKMQADGKLVPENSQTIIRIRCGETADFLTLEEMIIRDVLPSVLPATVPVWPWDPPKKYQQPADEKHLGPLALSDKGIWQVVEVWHIETKDQGQHWAIGVLDESRRGYFPISRIKYPFEWAAAKHRIEVVDEVMGDDYFEASSEHGPQNSLLSFPENEGSQVPDFQ